MVTAEEIKAWRDDPVTREYLQAIRDARHRVIGRLMQACQDLDELSFDGSRVLIANMSGEIRAFETCLEGVGEMIEEAKLQEDEHGEE